MLGEAADQDVQGERFRLCRLLMCLGLHLELMLTLTLSTMTSSSTLLLCVLVAVVATAAQLQPTQAWWCAGHMIVAQIAANKYSVMIHLQQECHRHLVLTPCCCDPVCRSVSPDTMATIAPLIDYLAEDYPESPKFVSSVSSSTAPHQASTPPHLHKRNPANHIRRAGLTT